MHEIIRDAILNEWDPIGVRDIPGAENEYDGYASIITEMIRQKKSRTDIFNYLWWAETENMGLIGDRQRTNMFVDRLLLLINNT